jgi:hypothetical protein
MQLKRRQGPSIHPSPLGKKTYMKPNFSRAAWSPDVADQDRRSTTKTEEETTTTTGRGDERKSFVQQQDKTQGHATPRQRHNKAKPGKGRNKAMKNCSDKAPTTATNATKNRYTKTVTYQQDHNELRQQQQQQISKFYVDVSKSDVPTSHH